MPATPFTEGAAELITKPYRAAGDNVVLLDLLRSVLVVIYLPSVQFSDSSVIVQ